MTQIIFNSKYHKWNSKTREFSMSERHVPGFASEYSILNPASGKSCIFKLSHSTGSEWDPETKRLFKVNLKMIVADQRGVLAKIAAAIAEAGSNIDNISMEESDNSAYTNILFTVQIENRLHLADLMRRLRKLPDVVRINRVKGTTQEQRVQ